MPCMPIDLALPLVGLVVRIDCHFLLLPFALARTLARFPTTIGLVLSPWVGIDNAAAIGICTLNLLVHGLPPTGEKP